MSSFRRIVQKEKKTEQNCRQGVTSIRIRCWTKNVGNYCCSWLKYVTPLSCMVEGLNTIGNLPMQHKSTPWVPVGRQVRVKYVAVARLSDKSLRLFGRTFVKNFVSRDRILSSRQQNAQNQISLNLCPNVATTKFCHRDNCFLQKFPSENDAIHRCDVLQPTVSRAWVCFSFDLNAAFQTKISFCYFVVLTGVLFRRLINRSIFY